MNTFEILRKSLLRAYKAATCKPLTPEDYPVCWIGIKPEEFADSLPDNVYPCEATLVALVQDNKKWDLHLEIGGDNGTLYCMGGHPSIKDQQNLTTQEMVLFMEKQKTGMKPDNDSATHISNIKNLPLLANK